jgi:hypothetical protein
MKTKSKLIKEVLNLKKEPYDAIVKDNMLSYIIDNPSGSSEYEVNIFEFAAECKLWAAKNGYTIHTSPSDSNTTAFINMNMHGDASRTPIKWTVDDIENWISLDVSEPEIITLATEWILLQKENNE